jgi:hypothetical protein
MAPARIRGLLLTIIIRLRASDTPSLKKPTVRSRVEEESNASFSLGIIVFLSTWQV